MNLQQITELRTAADSDVAKRYGVGAVLNLEQLHELLDALTGAQAQIAVLLVALEIDSMSHAPADLDAVRARLESTRQAPVSGSQVNTAATEAAGATGGSSETQGASEAVTHVD